MLSQGKVKRNYKLKKNKLGVSEVVGYILLISIAVAMSIVVYAWLKSYVPKEPMECPSDVSLMIQDIKCVDNTILQVNIKNNGKFNIQGYSIKAARDETKTIATDDIASKITQQDRRSGDIINFVKLEGNEYNTFEPGSSQTDEFDLSKGNQFDIKFIDIVPVRYQEYNGKQTIVRCTSAKIRQKISCPEELPAP